MKPSLKTVLFLLPLFFAQTAYGDINLDLLIAADVGYTAEVKRLLKQGADPNAKSDGWTALGSAAYTGHTETVKALIDAGADVNVKNSFGTALMAAAEGGRIEMARALIDAGADVNAKDENGKTALIKAADKGRTEIVKALIDAGADVSAKSKTSLGLNGVTALMEAASGGHTEAVKALIDAGADVNVKVEADETTVMRVADGQTALMWAAQGGHTETVKALIDAGADVNAKQKSGWNALMMVAYHGHTEIAEILIEAGADVNAEAEDGWTALMAAVEGGHIEMVRALLDAGADVNVKANDGKTAVMYAEEGGHTEIVALLEDVNEKKQKRAAAGTSPDLTEIVELLKQELRKEQQQADAGSPPDLTVDIETLSGKPAPKRKDAYAVVVGVEQYTDLPPAEYAARDAEWVKNYLVHVLGYPEENVQVLTNERATRARLVSIFETWLPNQEPKGSTFVYYSGHGAPDPKTGEQFLIPADGTAEDVHNTAYPLKRLAEKLAALPSKYVTVVIDSCFSGQPGTRSAIAKGAKLITLEPEENVWGALGAKGLVFTAGAAVSTTFEEKKHGLFTYYFLKGLRGEADANGDGKITARELFDYTRPEVVRAARRRNVEQEPDVWPSPERLEEGRVVIQRPE